MMLRQEQPASSLNPLETAMSKTRTNTIESQIQDEMGPRRRGLNAILRTKKHFKDSTLLVRVQKLQIKTMLN